MVHSNKTYRLKDCFDLCTQELIISKCGCYSTVFDNPNANANQTRPCLNLNDNVCVFNTYLQVDTIQCASEYCPLECDLIQYETSVSSIIYPTINDYSNMTSAVSFEEWRTQFVNLNIYYPQLDYNLLEETAAINFAG